MITASAPGRCGIIGNPSDLYGGSVISCSLAQRASVVLEEGGPLAIRSGDLIGTVRSAEDLQLRGDYLDVVRAVLTHFWDDLPSRGFSLACATDVPAQAGLAGSTALLTAIAAAVLEYLGRRIPPHGLAETVHDIEFRLMRTACGYQDMYSEVFGGLSFMDFRGKEGLGSDPDEPYATVEPLLPRVPVLPFVLASTGVQRNSGAVHRPLRERWEAGEPAVVDSYRRVARLGQLGKRAILEGDWQWLGALMNENQEIQRGLGASHEACDRLIQAARDAGAYGAKLAGAGNGGTIVACHPDGERLAAALREAGAFRIIVPQPGAGVLAERRA